MMDRMHNERPKTQANNKTIQPDASSERTGECVGGVDSGCGSSVSYLRADSNQRGGARRNVPLNPLYPKALSAPDPVPKPLLSHPQSQSTSWLTSEPCIPKI